VLYRVSHGHICFRVCFNGQLFPLYCFELFVLNMYTETAESTRLGVFVRIVAPVSHETNFYFLHIHVLLLVAS
jgi:hypothetical protein